MTTEGTFPKVDGDILYASEVNPMIYGAKDLYINEVSGGTSFTTSNDLYTSALSMTNGSGIVFRTNNNVNIQFFKNNIIYGISPNVSGTWLTTPSSLSNATDQNETTETSEGVSNRTGSDLSYFLFDLSASTPVQAVVIKYPSKPSAAASYTTRNFTSIGPGSLRYIKVDTWVDGTNAMFFAKYSPNASTWTTFGSCVLADSTGSSFIKILEAYVMGTSGAVFNLSNNYGFTSFNNIGSKALIATQGVTTSGTLKFIYNI